MGGSRDVRRGVEGVPALSFAALVAGMLLGVPSAVAQSKDWPSYHGGRVFPPNIACLLWSPDDATGFTQRDADAVAAHLQGIVEYLSNNTSPPGATGAGIEPTLRQYGVWGASFPGSCVVDHTNPGGPLSMKPGPGLDRIKAEVGYAQQALQFQPYEPQNLNVVFTKGWPYEADQPGCAVHAAVGDGQYLVINPVGDVCPEVTTVPGHAAQAIFDAITDPDGASWYADTTSPSCHGGRIELADDGGDLAVSLPSPTTPVLDSLASVQDHVDQVYGDGAACGTAPGGTLFTQMTTTPPVTVVRTGNTINVLARRPLTPSGFVHLISTDDGATYTPVAPPIGNVTDLPAAYTTDGRTLEMYGRGLDAYMYRWTYNGAVWSAPLQVGGWVIGSPAGACSSAGPAVFLVQNDGVLYLYGHVGEEDNWWDDGQPPVPALGPPQVFWRGGSCLDVYVTGLDGHIYRHGCAVGDWQKIPGPGFGLLSAVNRAGASRVDVFMRAPVSAGGSQIVWAEYDDTNLLREGILTGVPSGVGPVAAVEVGAANQIWLLFTRANQIYIASSDPSGTSYLDWGPVESPKVTSPLTAFAPDARTVLAFARRQSDGHLIQLRWLSGCLQPVQDLGVEIM